VVIHDNQQISIQWMEGKTMLRELSTSIAPHIFCYTGALCYRGLPRCIFGDTASTTHLLLDFEDIFAEPFCFIAFDPGGMLPLSKGLFSVFHTIHNLEAVSVIFDPEGNRLWKHSRGVQCIYHHMKDRLSGSLVFSTVEFTTLQLLRHCQRNNIVKKIWVWSHEPKEAAIAATFPHFNLEA